MAMDWILVRCELHTHPKVVRILSRINRTNPGQNSDILRTVGGLHAVWSIFDAHTEDGHLDGYTLDLLDTMIRWPGFSAAMAAEGWLFVDGDKLICPEFDEHNSKSGKRRAEDNKRKRKERESEKCPKNVQKTSDKSRTEFGLQNRTEQNTLSTNVESVTETADAVVSEQEASDSVTAAQFVMTSWNAVGPVRSSRLNDKLKSAIKTRLRSPWWSEHWVQALEKVPDCGFLNGDGPRGWKADFAWFLKPNSVQEILDGKYDASTSTAAAPKSASTTRFTNTISALEQWVIDSTARLDGVRENDCPSLGSEVDH